MEGKIEINKNEYINLKLDAEKLRRLENGGVDNWEWYGEALSPNDDVSMDDFELNLIEKIKS